MRFIEPIAGAFVALICGCLIGALILHLMADIPPAFRGPIDSLRYQSSEPAKGTSGGEIRIDGRRYEMGA